MSNLGFFHFARDNGIDTAITKVGDRYVLEEMLRCDYRIGGEQSGHIIFTDYATTGDGELSAVQTLATLKRKGVPFSELASIMKSYPQVLVNVTVSNQKKPAFSTDPAIRAAIEKVEAVLGEDGRVLVRASGTEPLIRVMLEGTDTEQIRALAEEIADVVCARLDGTYRK